MLAARSGYTIWFLRRWSYRNFVSCIQLPLYLLITGLSGGICLWLIPNTFGLKGAAFALLIAAVGKEVLLMAG